MSEATSPLIPGGDPLADQLQRHLECAGQVSVQRVETHISWVLLAGDRAYKIKKPVHFGFLDFSALDARRYYCEEEVRLNRRLAPHWYLGVVPIHRGPGGATLAADGPIVDYAVEMRRFPADALASKRVVCDALSASDLTQLAVRLAGFHDTAGVAAADSNYATKGTVLAQALQALDGLAAQTTDDCAPLRRWFTAQAAALAPRWTQRRQAGRVREGHGDLHLDNVLVVPDDATAFDCIEFDPALRWIDVMADIAYLMMDLLAHGRRDLAFGFLDAYLDASGDHDGLDVLRYYLVYRAVVRAMVHGLREGGKGGGSGVSAGEYLRLAQQLAQEGTKAARLLITHGLPGSGKSQLSGSLMACAGAVRLRSDVERKRLAGLPALADSRRAGDLYTTSGIDATYARLAELVRVAIAGGFPTIVDAAFLQRAQRNRFAALARELQVPWAFLDCQAPMPVLQQRVAQRQSEGQDASEAGPAVLAMLLDEAEPLGADEQAWAIAVRTDLPIDAAAICARWLQGPTGA